MIKLNGRVVGYAIAFTLSVGVGAQLPRIGAPLLRRPDPTSPAVIATPGAAVPMPAEVLLPPVAAVPLRGGVDLAVVPPRALPSDKWDSAVAVLMTAREWRSCEDIGRQLRELRREADARGVPIVFWTDRESFDAVAIELHRERLSGVGLFALDDLGRSADGGSIQTPAVVHFDPAGRMIAGASYPERESNVRAVPFVVEIWPTKR